MNMQNVQVPPGWMPSGAQAQMTQDSIKLIDQWLLQLEQEGKIKMVPGNPVTIIDNAILIGGMLEVINNYFKNKN